MIVQGMARWVGILACVLVFGGCEVKISDQRFEELTKEATSPWLDATGLQITRKAGTRFTDTGTEMLYLELSGYEGDSEALIRQIEAAIRQIPHPVKFEVKASPNLHNARGSNRDSPPPFWFVENEGPGTIVSIHTAFRVYIPKTGPFVYVNYFCP